MSVDRVHAENKKYWPKQYQRTGVMPISEDIDCHVLDQYVILNGGIERLPGSFSGRFEAIVSMDTFEYISKFARTLDRTYDAARPEKNALNVLQTRSRKLLANVPYRGLAA